MAELAQPARKEFMSLFITDEVASNKLNSEKNLVVKHKIIGHGQASNGGRPANGKNLSPELKGLLGTLAKTNGVKATAEVFGLSQNQVGAYKDGKTSDRTKPDPKVREVLDRNIDEIHSKVVEKILGSLNSITDEKVEEAGYAALTKGASNLAGVLDKLREKDSSVNLNQQFVFYGVKPRNEESYKVIEVEAVAS